MKTLTKAEIFLCLAIGNLSGAVIWNPPVSAWDLATGYADMMNGLHDSLAPEKTEAQTPLPVPQMEAPIGNVGNQSSLQPCAAPPPTASPTALKTPISSPSPIPQKEVMAEPDDRTIWLASRLKYPQSLSAIVSRFGTPSISTWDTPKSFTHYTTETGRTLTFEVNSFRDKPDVVIGYSLK